MRSRASLPACLLAACAALGPAAAPALAEVSAKHWNFTYQFGGTFVSRDIGNDNLSSSVRAGYNFTPWIGLEGTWQLLRTEDPTDDGLDSDVDVYSLDLLYHFRPDGSSVAYVLLGAGLVEVDLQRPAGESFRDSAFLWEGGGGVKIPVNKWIDIRFDIRFQRYRLDREVAAPAPLNGTLSDDRFANRTFSFGAAWHFPAQREGRPEPPVPEEPAEPAAPEPPAPPPPPPPAPTPPPAEAVPPEIAPSEGVPPETAPSEPAPPEEAPAETQPAPAPEGGEPSEPAPEEPSEPVPEPAEAPPQTAPEPSEPAPEPAPLPEEAPPAPAPEPPPVPEPPPSMPPV